MRVGGGHTLWSIGAAGRSAVQAGSDLGSFAVPRSLKWSLHQLTKGCDPPHTHALIPQVASRSHACDALSNLLRIHWGSLLVFPIVFKGFWETICGFGKPFAVLSGRPCGNTRKLHAFCTFPEECPAAPSTRGICPLHCTNAQHKCTHVDPQ